ARSMPVKRRKRWRQVGGGGGWSPSTWGATVGSAVVRRRRAACSLVLTLVGASNPKWRILTKLLGRTWRRKRAMKSTGLSVQVPPFFVAKQTARSSTERRRWLETPTRWVYRPRYRLWGAAHNNYLGR